MRSLWRKEDNRKSQEREGEEPEPVADEELVHRVENRMKGDRMENEKRHKAHGVLEVAAG